MAVVLRPGREKSLRQRHRWIFSGAIQSIPDDYIEGEVIDITSVTGDFLGRGWFRRSQSLAGRVLTWQPESVEMAVSRALATAFGLRRWLFNPTQTNAWRLVNAEADGLPGLIIDIYDKVAVIQSGTLGTDRLLPVVVKWLQANLVLTGIYEKSDGVGRQAEQLPDTTRWWLGGAEQSPVAIREDDRCYWVDVVQGQKTGFFLDQRAMRSMVQQMAAGRDVANLFGYTGGFSVAAALGGARSVATVDISAAAISAARENYRLNNLPVVDADFVTADVMEYLAATSVLPNLVVVDPPAFAKRRDHVANAMVGYRELNRLVLSKVPVESVVVTSSCSHFIDEVLFTKVVFQAALAAGRTVRIIGRQRPAPDHPISIYHPESEYLKSLVLWID